MIKLIETDLQTISRGDVLRFPTNLSYYEDYIYYMLVLTPKSLGLVIISGYKAGHLSVVLPEEALFPGTHMISVEWLKANFQKWVWQETPVSEVEIILKPLRTIDTDFEHKVH